MRSTTRNLLLGGTATALIVTTMTYFGSDWRPFTDGVENVAASFGNGFADTAEGALRWMLETEVNPATILVGFVAWLSLATIVRRTNRAWKLSGHASRALKSDVSKGIGVWTGLIAGLLIIVGALGIGGAYAGVALGENFKPQVNAAYAASERWIEDRIDDLTGETEPAAAPASPAAPTGDTRTEAPTDTRTTAPADDETEAPADTRTESPAGEPRTETPADTRTDTSDTSDDKPVTDALSGVLTDADRIVNDPVKFAEQEPLRAAFWALAILLVLVWLIRRPFVWRNARQLRSWAEEDDRRIKSTSARMRKVEDEIEALKNPGGTGDTRVISGPIA